MEKIEKICVLNFIFKSVAGIGTAGIFATALLSDGGTLTFAETAAFCVFGLVLAAFGIWGTINCTRFIESYRKSLKKRMASVRPYTAPRTANAA